MAEGIPADAFDAEAVTNAQALALSIQPHSQPQSHPKSNSLPSPIPTPIPITTAIPIPAPAPPHHGIRGTCRPWRSSRRRGAASSRCSTRSASSQRARTRPSPSSSSRSTRVRRLPPAQAGPTLPIPFSLCVLAHTLHASFRLHTLTTLNADTLRREPEAGAAARRRQPPDRRRLRRGALRGQGRCSVPLGASTPPCRCLHPPPSLAKVVYSCRDFLLKNKDPLSEDLQVRRLPFDLRPIPPTPRVYTLLPTRACTRTLSLSPRCCYARRRIRCSRLSSHPPAVAVEAAGLRRAGGAAGAAAPSSAASSSPSPPTSTSCSASSPPRTRD